MGLVFLDLTWQMNSKTITINTLEDTEKLGALLGMTAWPGMILCLDGDLGAGKTALTQAIARGLQVPESSYVSSPSFAIMHEYKGRLPLYHMDFYRLTGEDEVQEGGFEDYFYGEGLTVIEWSRRCEDLLPSERLFFFLAVTGEKSREIRISWSDSYASIVSRILTNFSTVA